MEREQGWAADRHSSTHGCRSGGSGVGRRETRNCEQSQAVSRRLRRGSLSLHGNPVVYHLPLHARCCSFPYLFAHFFYFSLSLSGNFVFLLLFLLRAVFGALNLESGDRAVEKEDDREGGERNFLENFGLQQKTRWRREWPSGPRFRSTTWGSSRT